MANYRSSERVTFVDAFAGCGGLSLGLLQAGLTGRFAIERDRFAFETLRVNLLSRTSRYRFQWPKWLPKAPIEIEKLLRDHLGALRTLKGKVDLLVGGPPCQGFSCAGRRDPADPRNKLFTSYLEMVDAIDPRSVLIENVRGFTQDFDREFGICNYSATLRRRLASRYDVFEQLIDLSAFGVPQRRTRYFLLALKPGIAADDPFKMLHARLPSFLRALRISAPVSSWAAISDLEISLGGTKPSEECPGFDEIRYTKPKTQFQKLMHDGGTGPSDLRLARHSTEIARRFQEIIESSHAAGRLNTSISANLRARFGLKKRALRVLDPEGPAPTITSLPDDLLHYQEPRALTVRENARLQSFPDWFSFTGKYTTGGHLRRKEVPRFTQVANAVPPLVAQAIGEFLIELLRDRPRDTGGKVLRRLKASEQIPEFFAQI